MATQCTLTTPSLYVIGRKIFWCFLQGSLLFGSGSKLRRRFRRYKCAEKFRSENSARQNQSSSQHLLRAVISRE